MSSLSTLVRLGLLAGFLVAARRILAPEQQPTPRLAPPEGEKPRRRKAPARQRA